MEIESEDDVENEKGNDAERAVMILLKRQSKKVLIEGKIPLYFLSIYYYLWEEDVVDIFEANLMCLSLNPRGFKDIIWKKY